MSIAVSWQGLFRSVEEVEEARTALAVACFEWFDFPAVSKFRKFFPEVADFNESLPFVRILLPREVTVVVRFREVREDLIPPNACARDLVHLQRNIMPLKGVDGRILEPR